MRALINQSIALSFMDVGKKWRAKQHTVGDRLYEGQARVACLLETLSKFFFHPLYVPRWAYVNVLLEGEEVYYIISSNVLMLIEDCHRSPPLALSSHSTQTYTIVNSKLNTQIHLYIHGSLQSSAVRSVQGQRGLFLFPGHDRGWWLVVIDSWMFGLVCHLWGFTIGKAFTHIQYRTLARSLSHTHT